MAITIVWSSTGAFRLRNSLGYSTSMAEVGAWQDDRNEREVVTNWTFTTRKGGMNAIHRV
jgi:hypothetical protein